jgi:hypothetical protein
MLNAVAPLNGLDYRGSERLMAEPPERHEDQQAHAVATLARDQVGDRRDVVEVSMDLSRLVEALGPDVLLEIPKTPHRRCNVLPVRVLISTRATVLPGFIAELAGVDPLRRLAFRVEARHEHEFVEGLGAVVRETLLEPRRPASGADGVG